MIEKMLKRYTCGCEIREIPDKFTKRTTSMFPCPLHKSAPEMYSALWDVQAGLSLNQGNETPESLRYVIRASLEIIGGAMPTAEGATPTVKTQGSAYLALLKEPLLYIQKCVSGLFKDTDSMDFGARKLSAEKEIAKILNYITPGKGTGK